MQLFNQIITDINAIIWHNYVLFTLLGTGVVLTFWSGFSQYRALTHGWHILRGHYDDPNAPGAINHFQALSTALSATVGLGNIGGVALAVSLGGPGAIFWMWVVGLFGMATKLTEVTLSMLHRNTDDPDNPHGGPMWVAKNGLPLVHPKLAGPGRVLAAIFCVCLLISTLIGGNMFQAWNVGEITQTYFGIPSIASGIVLSIVVGIVIIGGIKRIGAATGRLVPVMVAMYMMAGTYVLAVNVQLIPEMFMLIFRSAFSTSEAGGAFIGGTFGYAFMFGMKRALFSNEAGEGSSPMAHSAAKTSEPVREGIVAGLEPFIDTLVVCTFTALVILTTGIWNRPVDAAFTEQPVMVETSTPGRWSIPEMPAPHAKGIDWVNGQAVYAIVSGDLNPQSDNTLHRINGLVEMRDDIPFITWGSIESAARPTLDSNGVFLAYVGATLTAKAFDTVSPGLGKWLITLSVWMFAISTIISWAYYGEQGVVYLVGEGAVTGYKMIYCLLIAVATLGLIKTDAQLDNITGIGTGVMILANLPILWLGSRQAITAYKEYIERLKNGELGPGHTPPSLEDLVSGRDVK